jgi:hypothetical protein
MRKGADEHKRRAIIHLYISCISWPDDLRLSIQLESGVLIASGKPINHKGNGGSRRNQNHWSVLAVAVSIH